MLRILMLLFLLTDLKYSQPAELDVPAWNFLKDQKKYAQTFPSNILQRKQHFISLIIELVEVNLNSLKPLNNLTSENLQKILYKVKSLYDILPLSEYLYELQSQDKFLQLSCEKGPIFPPKMTVYLKYLPPFESINDIPESEKSAFLSAIWDTFLDPVSFSGCTIPND